jgi:hypothetical protein
MVDKTDKKTDPKTESEEELKEFKSDHSESEIADPVSKGSNKRPADKTDGDKSADKLSRAEIMKSMMYQAAKMDYDTLKNSHGKFTSVFDGDSKDMSKKNLATITTKEDIDGLFADSENLSEDFKDKANVIFEAAVNARIAVETTRIEEEYEAKLEEGIAEKFSELEDQIDSYLSSIVEQWMDDNALAVETSVKVDVMESFLSGLKGLFEEHYVEIPEDQVDIIEALTEQIEEMEKDLNEEIENRVKLQDELKTSMVENAKEEILEGLTDTDQEKLEQLFEGIEFSDPDDFTKKATIIAENFVKNVVKKADADHLLTEELEMHTDDKEKPLMDENMSRYTDAISRTVKK